MSDVAGRASEDGLKSTEEMLKSMSDSLKQFFDALLEYLEKNMQYAGHREIATWIKDGKGVCMYTARGDCAVELKQALKEYNVPFIVMDAANGRECFIIKDKDVNICQQINKEVLTARGNYFQQVTGDELETAIAKSEKIKNKDILVIDGLTKNEAEVLKHKCNDITNGFMVGLDKMTDDTYRLSVHAPKMISMDPKKMDLCKAYTQAMLSLYGPNREIKEKQLEADAFIEENINNLKGTSDVVYIVGAHDSHQFVEINSDGFEYYNTEIVDGMRQDKFICKFDKDDPNYESELQRTLDKIHDKAIMHSFADIQDHLNGVVDTIHSMRPEKTAEQALISAAENELVNKMDQMIKAHSANDNNFVNGNADIRLQIYQNETIKFMNGLESGITPEGYDSNQFLMLRESLIKKHMDFSLYTEAKEKIKNNSIDIHKATPKVAIRTEHSLQTNTR